MRLSHLFTKTSKDAQADASSKNADLLVRGGFIHKTMAGAYSYLPLGLCVLSKIETILREGRAFQAPNPGTLRVRYSPRIARWIAEREGKQLEQDGSLTMEHPVADTDWAVRHLLQYGPEVDVLEPEEIRTELQRRLQHMQELVV